MKPQSPRPSASLSGPMRPRRRDRTFEVIRAGGASDDPVERFRFIFDKELTLTVRPEPADSDADGWSFTIEIADDRTGRPMTRAFLASVLPRPGRDPEVGRFPAHDLLPLLERVDQWRPFWPT